MNGRLSTSILVTLALGASIAPSSAAIISDRDAKKHVGETLTVEGVVTGTHVSARGTEFLNFGSRYPNQDFTVVIFARSAAGFGDIEKLYGKRVDVTGTIELYRGKPEIVLRSPAQIRTAK
jgi:DNA/RNA endonuclease YhcR with UshA esterase domain